MLARLKLPLLPWFGMICRTLSVVRVPLVASILGAVALSVPDQVIELYRLQGEDGASQRGLTVLAVMLASLLMVYLAHALIKVNGLAMCEQSRVACWLSRLLPGVCGAILASGAAIGLWRASCVGWFKSGCKGAWADIPEEVIAKLPELKEIRTGMHALLEEFNGHGLFYALLAVFVFGLGLWLGRRYGSWTTNDVRSPTRRHGIFGWVRLLVFAVPIAMIVLVHAVRPHDTGFSSWGATTLFLLFLSFLAFTASLATARLDRHRVPALTMLLLIALGFSFFDLNDNHEVDLTGGGQAVKAPALNKAFKEWYASRGDRDQFKDKPYPVFIVAAGGGGLYAAQHTATFLARMQDRCPSFAQHTFAISSVSGGSVGASVFTALAEKEATNGAFLPCSVFAGDTTGTVKAGPLEGRVRRVLDNDFLSPLVMAMLFPDFLQRFWPRPVPALSRARALDATMLTAWSNAEIGKDDQGTKDNNPFLRGVREQWRPKTAAPALFLNATEVGDGRRFVIAPMSIRIEDPNPTEAFEALPRWSAMREYVHHFDETTSDIPLVSAVRLSASFPWITPAASVGVVSGEGAQRRRFKLRVVDGGLFENSGVETAHDIFALLKRFEAKPGPGAPEDQPWIKLHLVLVGAYTQVNDMEYSRLGSGLGELLSPIKSLLNARERRGYLAWYRFSTTHCGEMWDEHRCPVISSSLNLSDFHVPLGWRLSPLTTQLIALHTGRAERAHIWANEDFDLNSLNTDLRVRMRETIFGWIQENDESACNLGLLLAGRSPTDILSMRLSDRQRRWEVLAKGKSDIPPLPAADMCRAG